MLDQHPDGDLVRQPDVRAGESAVADLAPQHFQMLGDARRQPVPELGVGLEPLEFVVRAGGLEGCPGDLRGARQGGRRARVDQPRPAPHQRHEEQLGHRVQVKRQQRAVNVRRRAGVGGPALDGPPVPARDGHRELEPVVKHGARADRGRSRVDEPPAGRLPFAFHARQPDPVPLTRDVQRVCPADVRDPGALRGRRDHPGPPGQPPPRGYCQVNLWSAPEHQLATFREPDDLARHGTDMCGHGVSLGRAAPRRAPLNPGMAP